MDILINFICLDPRLLVLEVSPADMEGIEYTIGVAILFGQLPYGRYDPSRRALDFIDVPQMITDEPFGPQIGSPILEKEKGVEMDQQASAAVIITHQMEDFRLLIGFIVETESFSMRDDLLQPLHGLSLIHI